MEDQHRQLLLRPPQQRAYGAYRGGQSSSQRVLQRRTYSARPYAQPRRNERMLAGMAVFLLIVILLAARITAALVTPPQNVTPRLHNQALASQLDNLLTAQVRNKQFSGSVLIARDTEALLSKGYGMADWDHQVPNTPQTKFHVGSLTKQFTAMAILLLQEQGKLHVQDHLCTYIAACPIAWQSVTLQQLLTHTSGIGQLNLVVPLSSPQAWIAQYTHAPLVFRAGAQYSYCSVCYQILGYVIETVSGETYSVFLQHAIFDQLHMRDTGFDANYLSLPDHATGYEGWQVKAPSIDWSVPPQMSFLLASGLLYSTVEDLYRWDHALSMHTLVSQESLNEMFTAYGASEYPSSAYGYGWFIGKASVSDHRLFWHDGRIDGFGAYIGLYPDDKVSIIVLSNLGTLDERGIAKDLEQIVLATT